MANLTYMGQWIGQHEAHLGIAAFEQAAQQLGQQQGLLLAALKAGAVAARCPQPAQPAAVAM